MNFAIIGFVLGTLGAARQAELPGTPWLLATLGLALGLVVATRCWRPAMHGLPIATMLLGFAWASLWGATALSDRLPHALEGRDLVVTGVVAGLPQTLEYGVRFDFDVDTVEDDAAIRLPRRISLAWYTRAGRHATERTGEAGDSVPPPQAVRAGERWRFAVRLKRPHASLNPHGFDFEAWLFERGIGATGNVRTMPVPQRLDVLVWRPGYLIERARDLIRARFAANLPDAPYRGVLVALAIGDQNAVEPGLWRLFGQTGITHLMSISGLHITMLAALVGGLVGALWRRLPGASLRLPAQRAQIAAGCLTALLYSLLAGFAVPAQRTLFMLGATAIGVWGGGHYAAGRILGWALVAVLIWDPLAVQSAGFWLSFGAVALLLMAARSGQAGGVPSAGRSGLLGWALAASTGWLRAQWAITLGLIPALLALFQQFSLISPIANLIAIPCVSLLITPLALLAVLIPHPAPLVVANWLTEWLIAGCAWIAQWPFAVWQQAAPPGWTVAAGLLGVGLLLSPRGVPGRWLGWLYLAPLVFVMPARPPPASFHATVLDVGQGLAVHVQTAGRDLLYDTGPAYSTEADAGQRFLLPYLRARGVSRLSGLVLTHADSDHTGGARSVLAGIDTDWVASSLVPAKQPPHARSLPCRAGERWLWDGVLFEFLHPDEPSARENDRSCVLRIQSAQGSMLLTGDIEAGAERELVRRYGAALRSQVLVVPHHGSRTSSTPEFLQAVAPEVAVFPVGYRNRFRHPHPLVWQRYDGRRRFRTDLDGALGLDFTPGGLVTRSERAYSRRYWHDRPDRPDDARSARWVNALVQ